MIREQEEEGRSKSCREAGRERHCRRKWQQRGRAHGSFVTLALMALRSVLGCVLWLLCILM
jgi:hypothetical protein